MKKPTLKGISLMCALCALLLAFSGCAQEQQTDAGSLRMTIEGQSSTTETEELPEQDGMTLFVNKSCFKGRMPAAKSYQVLTEKNLTMETKYLAFAGQTFALSFTDRESTRKYNEKMAFDENSNLVNAGELICSYDSYEGSAGSLKMRASFPTGSKSPNMISVSGESMMNVEGKTEEEIRQTAVDWLAGYFRMNTKTMTCELRSLVNGKYISGFISGAELYRMSFREKTGVFMTRSADVVVTDDKAVLLARDGQSAYGGELLQTMTEEELTAIICRQLSDCLPSYSALSASLTEPPFFDAGGEQAYIEFTATVFYVYGGATASEQIGGLLIVDRK